MGTEYFYAQTEATNAAATELAPTTHIQYCDDSYNSSP
jgi:hypothetical protein